jgi:hypothetical protein
MTAQILINDLTTLIQDTKRKSPEIRTAAEKSLSDLKSLANTSEAQLAADLKRRPHFATPFVLACSSKNAKFASTSLSSLQRLVVSGALPKDALRDVLHGLRDCTGLAQDIQLRILQILPTLLQNFRGQISDDLLSTALHTCFLLLASKAGVISNTAAATLQQLVVSVFDKLQEEDDLHTDHFILDVPIKEGEISVQSSALDAYRVLKDLCCLVDGQGPEFMAATPASQNYCLELIEAVLSSHGDVVADHPEQVHVLRLNLMPFITGVLSDRVSFATTVRSMRLIPLILASMLGVLSMECEVLLGLLNNALDPDASILWKRALCMEVFRSIYTDASTLRSVYAHYDAQDGKKKIVQDQMSLLVHIASENPAVIGLSQHSTIPANEQKEDPMDEMAALQAEGISGTIGVAMTVKSSNASGISARLSSMRVPCLEQLDKNEAPSIPPAYVYSLSLVCLNNFSEGLAKFLLPFTVPNDKGKRRKRTKGDVPHVDDGAEDESNMKPSLHGSSGNLYKVPVNPLSLESHPLHRHIRASADMVETCWPALLAGYSTFLHAALDHDYYRDLVRSFQKFTQVSGILRMSTPRDAFLTTLSKNAIPASSLVVHNSTVDPRDQSQDRKSLESHLSGLDTTRSSIDTAMGLNSRNLLCLRALLNLGIALGPVLGVAWSIVIGSLQQSDTIVNHMMSIRQRSRSSQHSTEGSDHGFIGNLGEQINAVRSTAERMLESTTDLSDEAYQDALKALCALIHGIQADEVHKTSTTSPTTLAAAEPHRRGSSTSVDVAIYTADSRLNMFVVDKIGKIVQYNKYRFHETSADNNGYNLLSDTLQKVALGRTVESTVRICAARGLAELVVVTASSDVAKERTQNTRLLGLTALKDLVQKLHQNSSRQTLSPKSCEFEIHGIILETLRTVLEQYGDSLEQGWPEIFSIIYSSLVDKASLPISQQGAVPVIVPPQSRASKLTRLAFASLQLICSDFLETLPPWCYLTLLDTVSIFCSQQDDFNISLTSTTIFCNISDYLWRDARTIRLNVGDDDKVGTSNDLNEGVKSRIWYKLLCSLVSSTTDARLEVRRGATHSVFRILDASGERMPLGTWLECLRIILLPVLRGNHSNYQEQVRGAEDPDSAAAWNETIIMFLDGLPGALAVGMPGLLEESGFQAVWNELLQELNAVLDRRWLATSSAVFSTLAKISSNIPANTPVFSHPAMAAWHIWKQSNPAHHQGITRKGADNQAALCAYAQCFEHLYPHIQHELSSDAIGNSLQQLRTCVAGSSKTPYAGDIETLTTLQAIVFACIELVRRTEAETILHIITLLSYFVTIPLHRENTVVDAKGPTYVSLSKRAATVLDSRIALYKDLEGLYASGAFTIALEALCEPIETKYSWEQQGKDPQLWLLATQVTTSVLRAAMPRIASQSLTPSTQSRLWRAIVRSCTAFVAAPNESSSTTQKLLVDEGMDIKLFASMYELVVPNIGSPSLDTAVLQSFARVLFEHSLIHEPHPDDLSSDDDEPLSRLHHTHIGRTDDLPPSSRATMSYIVLDKLFDLVSVHDQSAARTRLAQVAAPFLVLRVVLTLKAYIMDHPLRGRVPQPASQRKELLYILDRLVKLDSETQEILDPPAAVSQHKKHLHEIEFFVIQAIGVPRMDDKIRESLLNVLKRR